jgi:hypothetical protein
MTTTRSFLGIPVEGDIVAAEKRTKQRPIEELSPVMQAVLDDPHVVEFGWQQYTPYFNDGDPCVFSVHGAWLRTDADDPEADTDELDIDYGHPTLSKGELEPWMTDLKAKADALGSAIDGGAFDDVLLEAFGDHAEVKVKRDGITVDEYSHD